MARVLIKAKECKYKGVNSRLKEHFTYDIYNQTMTEEIISELTVLKDMSEVMSKQVIAWAKRIKAQWSQKAILESLKEMNLS